MSTENPGRFRIGTCGYSYPGEPPKGWYGVFYPRGKGKRQDELEFYATFFNVVEINSTFYRPANSSMARAWDRKTPPDFAFAVKVWQKFTHPTKLGDEASGSGESWDRFDAADVRLFIEGVEPLADCGKLGALLFQYPASFRLGKENLSRLGDTLALFERYPKVVELRHRSWSDGVNETRALLGRLRAAWAYIDEPKFASSVRQEIEAGRDTVYIRLHGQNHVKWWKHREAWERYDYLYQPDQLRLLSDKVKQMSAKSPSAKFYVLFNNHARAQAVANALMFASQLNPEARITAPPGLVEAFPQLRSFPESEAPKGLF